MHKGNLWLYGKYLVWRVPIMMAMNLVMDFIVLNALYTLLLNCYLSVYVWLEIDSICDWSGIGIWKFSSVVPVTEAESLISVVVVSSLNWSKCYLTLLPSVRSTIKKEGLGYSVWLLIAMAPQCHSFSQTLCLQLVTVRLEHDSHGNLSADFSTDAPWQEGVDKVKT